jgi:hypothetical protein
LAQGALGRLIRSSTFAVFVPAAAWSGFIKGDGTCRLRHSDRGFPRQARCPVKSVHLSDSDAAILYSAISLAELWAGALPDEHDALNRLFGALACVPAGEEIGCLAGGYLRSYRKSQIEVAVL